MSDDTRERALYSRATAAATIASLEAQVKRLEAELAAAKEAVETLTTPHLLELHIERGVMEGRIDGRGMAKIIAAAFWDLLTKEKADNYVEMTLERGGRELIVHVQKRTGKTPAQFRAEAEAERDNAARNERIRWADRADSLAHDYRHGTHSQDVFEGAARGGAARALEALAAELRAEGGGE